MNKLQNLINDNFVCFTFSGISTFMNSKGEEKKKPMGMPKHAEINKDNFLEYCNSNHKAAAIITGKMSNITVIDFDDKECYETMATKYPDLKKYRTIKTNKGYHIYCKYDPNIISTTDALSTYPKVDIRNDGGIIFCSPTQYKLQDGSIVKYEDIGGEILPIPEIIMSDIKADKFIKKSSPSHCCDKSDIDGWDEDGCWCKNCNFKFQPFHFDTQAKKNKKEVAKKIKTEPQKNETEDLEYIANAIEKGHLDFKALSDSYDDWRNVGFIFKHTSDSKESLELFHKFSAINESKYDKDYTDAFWKTIKQCDKPLTIGTLKKWIREQTTDEEMIANTDLEAAKLLFEEMKNTLKSYNGRLFYFNNNIWIHDATKINNHLVSYIMNRNICSIDTKGKKLPIGQSISRAEKIAKSLIIKIHIDNNDPHLYDKFHKTTKTKICFNDGVLDFKAKTFTLWSKIPANTIYSTIKINRDFGPYFNNPNRKNINDISEKIFDTAYGKNKNRALHFLSRAIAGHAEDKRWATYFGNRNSGKGIEYDLLKYGFEDYVKTFELGNILYCRKTAGIENVDCSKKLYWLMDLEFTRLAVSQEIPDPKTQLVANGKMLKKISGGEDTIVARRNYDREDTHFTLDASFYIKGNFDLLIDSNDCNETRVEFNSVISFVDQSQIDTHKQYGMEEDELKRFKVADPTLRDKVKSIYWANAIVYYLYENYNDKRIDIISETTIDEITPFKAIREKYIITGDHNNDFILCQDVHDNLSEFCKGKLCIELQAQNVFKKKYQKAGPKYNRWCYSGIKLKPVEKEKEEIIMN